MDWTDNLKAYVNNGDSGCCPKCGSKNIEVIELSIGRGSLTFHCTDCNSFAHFDGTIAKKSDAP